MQQKSINPDQKPNRPDQKHVRPFYDRRRNPLSPLDLDEVRLRIKSVTPPPSPNRYIYELPNLLDDGSIKIQTNFKMR